MRQGDFILQRTCNVPNPLIVVAYFTVYNFSNKSFLNIWVSQKEGSAEIRATALCMMLEEMLCPGLVQLAPRLLGALPRQENGRAGWCFSRQELFIQRHAIKYLALFPAWTNLYQATGALLCNTPEKFTFGRELWELKCSKLAAHKAG